MTIRLKVGASSEPARVRGGVNEKPPAAWPEANVKPPGLDPAGLDADHVQITACCKHFVANSLENWNNATRHNFDADVSQSDLQNYYLPAFRGCVMEGGAQGWGGTAGWWVEQMSVASRSQTRCSSLAVARL